MDWVRRPPRCVVVGAGIIGTLAALRLAQAGAEVVLVDANSPGSGTSGSSFAWVNASSKEWPPYFDLNAAGLGAYQQLIAEFAPAAWFVQSGHLEWEEAPQAQETLFERTRQLRDWGYPTTLLSRQRVLAELEPDLRIGKEVESVVLHPSEGYVYPLLFIADMLRTLRKLGVGILDNTRVVGLDTRAARVEGVVLESGEHIKADVVVSCCGVGTSDLVGDLGIAVPLMNTDRGSPAVGFLVVSSPVTADVRHVIKAPGVNVRSEGAGRLLLHSFQVDREIDVSAAPLDGYQTREVLDRAAEVVPALSKGRAISSTVCIRPLPVDGISVVGWAPTVEGLYVIVTHSGVTLAPLLAGFAVKEIAGETEELLNPFRPDRDWTSPSTRV